MEVSDYVVLIRLGSKCHFFFLDKPNRWRLALKPRSRVELTISGSRYIPLRRTSELGSRCSRHSIAMSRILRPRVRVASGIRLKNLSLSSYGRNGCVGKSITTQFKGWCSPRRHLPNGNFIRARQWNWESCRGEQIGGQVWYGKSQYSRRTNDSWSVFPTIVLTIIP